MSHKHTTDNIYFVADLHLGHKLVLNFRKEFQTTEAMDDYILKQWNETVPTDAIVYILGDISLGSNERTHKILSRLNGTLYLIEGNHDKSLSAYNLAMFKEIFKYKQIKIHDQRIVLCHYPMRSWNDMQRGSWNLHGHCHGNIKPYGKSVDIGLDAPWITKELRPVSYLEVKEYMDKRAIESEDHHISEMPQTLLREDYLFPVPKWLDYYRRKTLRIVISKRKPYFKVSIL